METDIRAFLDRMASEVNMSGVPQGLIRRVRVRRLFTAAVAASLVVTAIFGIASGINAALDNGNNQISHPVGVTPSPSRVPQRWVIHVDARDGLSIATPKRWTYRDANISGPLFPRPEIAVGTWTFTTGGRCSPTKALTSLPPGGAFFYLYEQHRGSPSDFPRRPTRFHLGLLKGPFECLGVKTYLIQFRQHSRRFTIHVVLGRIAQTDVELKRRVLRSLDSLQVAPKPRSSTLSP